MPSDYDKEKWVEIYMQAILELEHAKMTGRIGYARIELAARIEKLRDIPGLHAADIQAIDDAYRTLRLLEGEGAVRCGTEKSCHRRSVA